MDWLNEIVNALVFNYTNYAPVWAAPGRTAFLILIGLNIEICFMFAVSGIIWTKMLLPSPRTRILGIPNRALIAVAGAVFCVVLVYRAKLCGCQW